MPDAAIAERVSAERRAAVAEYRAELATVDPVEYAATLEELARVMVERDEARAAAMRLDSAMRKRFKPIQPLAAQGLTLRAVSEALADAGMVSRTGHPFGPSQVRSMVAG